MRTCALLLMLLIAFTTTAPAVAQEAFPTPITYIIQRGDSLGAIATRFGVTTRALMEANDISNPELIYAGQTLTIPSPTPETTAPLSGADADTPAAATATSTPTATFTPTMTPSATPVPTGTDYVVQRGDTLARIATRFGTTVGAIIRANNLANPDVITVGQRLLIPDGSAAVTSTQAPPTPEITEAFAAPPISFDYGIEVFFPDENIDAVIQHLTNLSLHWVKVNVNWHDLEQIEGAINVTELDLIVDALDAAGLNIMFTVATTPAWAGTDPNSPPADFTLFATFLGALAQHYAGVIDAYEIWSEPNTRRMWNNAAHPLSAASYIELLDLSHSAIKSVDPMISVVSAGLAPTAVTSDEAINDREYLSAMYAAGVRPITDAIGIQPLGFGNPPDALCCAPAEGIPTHTDNTSYYFLNTLGDYHAIMIQQGDIGTQLWITGFGWGSSEDTLAPDGNEIHVSYNSLEEQSVYTAGAFEIGAEVGFVGPMFVSNLNGCAVNQDCYYSLLSPSGTPRPIYNVVRILFTPAE